MPLEDGRFVCQLHVQGSVVIGGLGDGLGGVEWEAEVAFGVTPSIFGFAGFLMAVIGGEGGKYSCTTRSRRIHWIKMDGDHEFRWIMR